MIGKRSHDFGTQAAPKRCDGGKSSLSGRGQDKTPYVKAHCFHLLIRRSGRRQRRNCGHSLCWCFRPESRPLISAPLQDGPNHDRQSHELLPACACPAAWTGQQGRLGLLPNVSTAAGPAAPSAAWQCFRRVQVSNSGSTIGFIRVDFPISSDAFTSWMGVFDDRLLPGSF